MRWGRPSNTCRFLGIFGQATHIEVKRGQLCEIFVWTFVFLKGFIYKAIFKKEKTEDKNTRVYFLHRKSDLPKL
jgi:hypothetical protein